MLTVQDWLTSSGRYPWRAKHEEVTAEVLKNAEDYVQRLNRVCKRLHIKDPKFSSGFRPSDVNKKTPGASKKSGHMNGTSGDLRDPDGKIDHEFLMNQNVLEEEGLYLEHPKYTEGWAHTQSHRPGSGNRVFIPK